ncbi:hypothetical protein DFH27DRAFT_615628 [Peziza echinospora]|nr:hypothetical protein DFH27DRAFT_615628 [Peziza echinospora]
MTRVPKDSTVPATNKRKHGNISRQGKCSENTYFSCCEDVKGNISNYRISERKHRISSNGGAAKTQPCQQLYGWWKTMMEVRANGGLSRNSFMSGRGEGKAKMVDSQLCIDLRASLRMWLENVTEVSLSWLKVCETTQSKRIQSKVLPPFFHFILPGGAPEPALVHPLDQVNTYTLAILNRRYPSLIHAYRPPWHGHNGTFFGRRDPVTGTWSLHFVAST